MIYILPLSKIVLVKSKNNTNLDVHFRYFAMKPIKYLMNLKGVGNGNKVKIYCVASVKRK